MGTTLKVFLIVLASTLISLFMFFLVFLNHTSINEIGIEYNSYNGEIKIQDTPGWYKTGPLTKVAYVSTLPVKIVIPSNARVIVAKIVRFNPKGVEDFIRMQGFSYSVNSSFRSTMLGYAFSGNKYSFLDILQETTDEDLSNHRPLHIIEDSPSVNKVKNIDHKPSNTPTNDTIQ